jgi:hypothetical protein
VLLLGVAAAGCATTKVSLRPEPRSFTARDYEGVYDAWTRDADAFEFGRLSDILNVTATFQSWEFRWAYVVRYAEDHSMRTEERAEMLRASLADARERHRFFVTMSGQKWRESDLTADETVWRVMLVDEAGEQTVPVEIERVERPGSALQAYFPSVSPFRHAFRIVFPVRRADGSPTIRDDARLAILRFTGPLGTVDLTWEFEQPGEAEE